MPPPEQHGAAAENLFQQAWTLHQAGQLSAALQSCEQALQLQPAHFNALHLSGIIALQAGNPGRAVELITNALAIIPDHVDALINRSNARAALRQFAEAAADCERAIAARPDIAPAHVQHGNMLRKLGRFEAAVASYDRAIVLQPEQAETHFNRGIALKELQQYEQAVAAYDRAIALNPGFVAALANRGVALAALQQHAAAIAAYDRAAALAPGIAFIHLHRGISLHALGQHDAALENYRQAIALEPGNAEARQNLGIALLQLRRHEDAIASFDRAIELNPQYADAHANRALALAESGQHAAALKNYEQAIALQPELRVAQRNASHLLLQLGQYEKGWAQFEWRLRGDENRANRRAFTQPLWLGREPLQGKTILLHSEQGLGDTLQFCRYAQQVAALGATVILEVQQPLARLLAPLQGVAMLVSRGSVLPPFDLHCPLMSLPHALQTRIDNIPAAGGYISADAAKISEWQTLLGAKTRPRVGLVWSGNPQHRNDSNRSIPLREFSALLQPGLEYVCLQKDIQPADQAILDTQPGIRCIGDRLHDFSDTAALCALMDLVISVDTSLAHLAGAMGKPVWVLLPFNPDWRWMLERSDSPWYSSARLYREQRQQGWGPVITRVREDLAQHFNSR